MATKPRQFNELHRKNMESAVHLAQTSIENLQAIVAIQMKVANMLFQANVDNANAIASAEDPQQAVTLRTQFTKKTMQTMIDAAREIAEIGNDSRMEFSRLLVEQLAGGSNEMMASFKTFFGTLPSQNSGFVEAMQQAMNQTNMALNQLTDPATRSNQA
ncbi:MAG: phasin family protein [Betaproteobacteria bacterium]|nr:phasin family protein [Betaproteobacteria bacterium]